VLPAAPFLIDFGLKEVRPEPAEQMPLALSPVGEDPGWAERVEEAYARGLEEGRASAQSEVDARLEQQRVELEQGLAATREAWCAEQGPQIAEHIEAAMRQLQDRIAQSAERVLRPFLAATVREQAIDQLRRLVQELLATNPGVTLEISGPEDLLDKVRASLSASVATVSYVSSESCDVQIKAGASIIETRIGAWLNNAEAQGT